MLKYKTKEVLSEGPVNFVNEEFKYGNYGLLSLTKAANLAGPFYSTSPWTVKEETGHELIFAGGYGSMPFGSGHPDIVNFINEFFIKNDDIAFTQHSLSKWRAILSANLISSISSVDNSHSDSRVFFSNSGSESIETAIKFAKFFKKEAKYFINFSNAYHGKTYAALSLTPNASYQDPFKPLMPNIITVNYNDIDAFQREIKRLNPKNIIAVIVEPIQGDAGVIKPSVAFLKSVDETCKKNDIILIADEVLSGIGRCGYWYTSIEYGGMSPDIITLAKPLSGGLVPIGATIVRNHIYTKMLSGINSKIQSNTFGGGALAMAVAARSLEIIVEQSLVERVKYLSSIASERLKKLVPLYPKLLKSINIEGLLWAIHFVGIDHDQDNNVLNKNNSNQLLGLAATIGLHRCGVMVVSSLGANPHIRLMPALNIPDDLFEELLCRIETFIHESKSSISLIENLNELFDELLE